MIAAIQLLKEGVQNERSLVTDFEVATAFDVPINYYDDAGFHYFAEDSRNAVEMLIFSAH